MQLTPFSFALNNAALPGDAPVDGEGAPEGFIDVLSMLLALPQMPVEQAMPAATVGVPGDLEDVIPAPLADGEVAAATEDWFSDIDAIESATDTPVEAEPEAPDMQQDMLAEGDPAGHSEEAADTADSELPAPEAALKQVDAEAEPALVQKPANLQKLDMKAVNSTPAATDATNADASSEETQNGEQARIDVLNAETDLQPAPESRATPSLKPRVNEEHLVNPGAKVGETDRESAGTKEEAQITAEAPEGAELPEAVAHPDNTDQQGENKRENARPQADVRALEAAAAERPHNREAIQQRAIHRTQSDDGAAALARRQFEIVRQVARDIAIRNVSGDVEMRMALSPPNLGTVKLRLRVEDGVVNGSMITDSAATRHVLQQHVNELREALAKEGLQLNSFDVSSESRESREQRRQAPRHVNHRFNEQGIESGQTFETARVNNGRVQGYL
jgi:flagellar hook-length control protein FliK